MPLAPAPLPIWGRLLIWWTALAAFGIVGLGFGLVYRELVKPPPFRFTATEYPALNPSVCPGDVLEFRPRLIVTKAPAVIVVARTLWDVADQRTIVPDRQPSYFVWTEQEQGQPVQRTVRYPLPADLPVGRYEVRGGASGLNTTAATYRVSFVIPESCKGRAP